MRSPAAWAASTEPPLAIAPDQAPLVGLAAGVRVGDVVVEVAGERPNGLADLFRRIWALGRAGTEVPLLLSRQGQLLRVGVRSADRAQFLWRPSLQ